MKKKSHWVSFSCLVCLSDESFWQPCRTLSLLLMVDIYYQQLYASTGATRNDDGDDDDYKLSLIIRAFQACFRSFLTNQCKKDFFIVWSLIFCRCFSIFNSTVSILGFQSSSVELGFWIAIFSGIPDSSGKMFPDS